MSEDVTFQDVIDEVMLEETEPSYEALVRWQKLYPAWRDPLAEYFAEWAVQKTQPPEAEAEFDEDAIIEETMQYAMDTLAKQGRLIPNDYVATIQPFDQLILSAVIELQGRGYNGNIARLASEMSGKKVLMGTALASLGRLERLKCLVWRYADPVTEPQNEGRRYYMATITGERSLAHARAAQREAGFQGDFA